jgi:hypothetical protein
MAVACDGCSLGDERAARGMNMQTSEWDELTCAIDEDEDNVIDEPGEFVSACPMLTAL